MFRSLEEIFVFLLLFLYSLHAKFTPDWKSLDSRPNPQWWNDAKFGIFIHWGVYSVPAVAWADWTPSPGLDGGYAEWYWYWITQFPNGPVRRFHESTYGPAFRYQDFATQDRFHAELFDPDYWADVFVRSGAKYVTLTAKHHDGFCLWPSAQSWNWNSVTNGPHRDLFGELTAAVKRRGLHMGAYFSLYEWYHPLYRSPHPEQYVQEVMLPQLYDLITTYQPTNLFVDGEWEHSASFWQSKEFLVWLFNESPVRHVVAVNDRWGNETRGRHGGYFVCEYSLVTPFCPPGAHPQHPWTQTQGMGHSFGYNRRENTTDYKTTTELISILIDVVSKGGNFDLNIGPAGDGRIPVEMQERLLGIGEWLKVTGEGVYGTHMWKRSAQGDALRFTAKGSTVYAFVLQWPPTSMLTIYNITISPNLTQVTLLGYNQNYLKWEVINNNKDLLIHLPHLTPSQVPCRHAWALKITNVIDS
jgi:alpha-L-fucosidase